MTYKEWIDIHNQKHKNLIKKLSHLSDDAIIEYFDFDNMVKNEPDFCPLYKENQKCHNLEKLNCYLCACPHFRVDVKKSFCSIDAKEGSSIVDNSGYLHQDCSKCSIPHKKEYIQKVFSRDWAKIMENVIL